MRFVSRLSRAGAAILSLVGTGLTWTIYRTKAAGRECDPGGTGPDPRLFGEAVLWIVRPGCLWRDLPADFGKWNSVCQAVPTLGKSDPFYCMFRTLAEDADFECAMVHGRTVKVHGHGQGAKGEVRDKPSGAVAEG